MIYFEPMIIRSTQALLLVARGSSDANLSLLENLLLEFTLMKVLFWEVLGIKNLLVAILFDEVENFTKAICSQVELM